MEKDQIPNRRKRIVLAYATSASSKVATGIAQILVLPLAAHSLGNDRFGALMMLGAIASFGMIPSQGLSPAVSYGIARAVGSADYIAERAEFCAVVVLSVLLALTIGSLALVLAFSYDPAVLFGVSVAPFRDEAFVGLILLVAQLVSFALFGWVDGLRAGYRENHITNLFTTGSSLGVLFLGAAASYLSPSIPAFFVALFLFPWLVQAVNLVLLLSGRRRYLLSGWVLRRTIIQETLHRATAFSLGQIGTNLKLHGTTFLAGRYVGFNASALFGTITRLALLLFGGVLGILQPLMPTISEGISRGDHGWVRRAIVYVIGISIGCGIVFGIAVALMGQWGLSRLIGLHVQHDPVFFASVGLMLCFVICSQGQFFGLIAAGLGPWAGKRILIEGVLGFAFAFFALSTLGLNLVILAYCAASVLLTAVAFPTRLLEFANRQAQFEKH